MSLHRTERSRRAYEAARLRALRAAAALLSGDADAARALAAAARQTTLAARALAHVEKQARP